ncbi:MAG: zinc-dependent metalloprotease, partial [Candidatus Acidiferrales bacterium]
MLRTQTLTGMTLAFLLAVLVVSGTQLRASGVSSPQPERAVLAQVFGPPPGGPAAEAKKSDEKKKEEKEKPFDEVVKEMEKIEGVFTFYRDKEENKVLVELAPGQLDRDYIFSGKVEQATGERGLYGTIMADQYIFQWRRLGKRVQFVQKNIRFRAQPGSPAARAVEKSFSDSVLSSGKIQSQPHPERKSVLVDLGEILLTSDLHGVGPYLKQVYKTGYQFDKENSGFVMVKSFPQNSELGAQVRFAGQEFPPDGSVTLTDARYLTLRLRYSLLEVPQNDYLPRLADDRVGYFVDQYMDFTSDRPDTPYVRNINRWHLKKKDATAGVSEPVEPLVFWLENSIPQEYREPIRDGILLWNAAFEKAGLKNAVVVKQQPDDADWDPADIRYNTIRWFMGYDATFAIGPSHSNPYTGQLLDADIGISEGILRLGARRRYQLYINPVARVQELTGELPAFPARPGQLDPRYLCHYGDGLAEQASMALDVLAGRPEWSPEKEKEFVRQYVMQLLAHEVGHTLGLRHNFRASILNRMDQLGDAQRTHSVGLAASVMDYNPAIVALKGEKQGDYLPTVVGSYDQWAIEYGYKPIAGAKTPEAELPELRKVASRAADPLLPYGTDEDTYFGARVIDPRNYPYDFADQPLDYFTHEYKVIKEIWGNMEAKLVGPG